MVEPLKPSARKRLPKGLSDEEYDEYERLLSARFEIDPSRRKTVAQRQKEVAQARRLQALAKKLAAG